MLFMPPSLFAPYYNALFVNLRHFDNYADVGKVHSGWFFQTVPTQSVSPFLLGTVPILSFVLVLPRIWNQTKNDRKS